MIPETSSQLADEGDQATAEQLARHFSLNPLTCELLVQCGIHTISEARAFLFPKFEYLSAPFEIPGMQESVGVVRRAVEAGSRILIHGDYDVDGVTASAILAKTLRTLGADFKVFLPHRVRDGYGFTSTGIHAAEAWGARLIVTVDCGITAFDTVKQARDKGIEVVVVDHHELSPVGVPKEATVLHSLVGSRGERFKDLSAAGLAFKMSQALLGQRAREFLDLAALGTVADLATLRGENRVLVKLGLEMWDQGGNRGLKALRKTARLNSARTTARHLAFIFGPRINASGRVDSAESAYYLLISENDREAESLARVLEEENRVRQGLERRAVAQAVEKVEREVHFNEERVIVVSSKDWHPGVVGIVAARLVERYYRPSVVISLDEHAVGKGSARSIKGFNIYEALCGVASSLIEFGGHEQAAGLKINERDIASFRRKMNEIGREKIRPEDLIPKVKADLEVPRLRELSPSLARELEHLEPFGPGNPRPLFLTQNLRAKPPWERWGRNQLRFWVDDGETTLEAFCPDVKSFDLSSRSRLDLIYSPVLKSWQGQESVVLEVKEVREDDRAR